MFSQKALMDIKKSNQKNIDHDQALAAGTRLYNCNYEILGLDLVTNTCLIYKAVNKKTSEYVCIKEFFPKLPSGFSEKNCIRRNFQTNALELNKEGESLDSDYEVLMKKFLIKQKFHENICLHNFFSKVNEIFYENNTVYVVLAYNEWPSLKDFLESDMPLSFERMDELVYKLLKETMIYHNRGLIHGSICPEKIYLYDKGLFLEPKLMNEANQKVDLVDDHNRYRDPDFILTQANLGPYSDVYALGKITIDLLLKMASTQDYFKALEKIPKEKDRNRYDSTIKKAIAFKISNRIRDAKALKYSLFEHIDKEERAKSTKKMMALFLTIAILGSLMVAWWYG